MKGYRLFRTVVLILVALSLFGCSLTINTCNFGHAGDGGTVIQGGPVGGGEPVEGWLVVVAVFSIVALLLVFAMASRDGLGRGPGPQ